MSNLENYVKKFFDELEIYVDIHNSHHYKNRITQSIDVFLKEKTHESAFEVYKSFFDAYWIGIQDEINPFLKLIEQMKKFEIYGGRLIEKQRDHYIHSVFVFLLGLSIYIQNQNYRDSFKIYALDKTVYPDSYSTNHEEFFYRWGLASLFHDIAYPLEIIIKQANEYISFLCSYPDESSNELGFKVELLTSKSFLILPNLKPEKQWEDEFNHKYQSCTRFTDNSISLLSTIISENFDVDLSVIMENTFDFLNEMRENNFIDHGFCSAVIMLRWYHHLIKTTKWNPAYFYFPILDSSSAIFLHNSYKHRLMHEPINLGLMNVYQHPIAYLLILCDEIQEWDRKEYGRRTKNQVILDYDNIFINETKMNISYDFNDVENDIEFSAKKTKDISDVITISNLFINGITIK